MDVRVGFGYDVHQLKKNLPFILGGIAIPAPFGAIGHSDADVLLHAISDALLGAACLGDIGNYFPSDSSLEKGFNSRIIVEKVNELLIKEHYVIGNIDTTIVVQKPAISSYIPEISLNIANMLGVAPGQVSVKATTTDMLGYIGEEKGIAAYAIALLKK